MCHAAVTNPFGGPHFCGDEAGYVTVSDTLKISKGTWGGTSASIQWFADDVVIKGATKTALPLKGLKDKFISVRISTNVGGNTISEWFDPASYYDPDLESDVFQSVTYATNVTAYLSGDFVPCTAFVPFDLTWQQQNGGNCSGTKGQANGALQSNTGTAPGKYREDEVSAWVDTNMAKAFWAHRDITLPAKTFLWTWGVTDAWSRGVNVQGEGEDYPLFGSPYFGFIPPAKLVKGVSDWEQWNSFSMFDVSADLPLKRTQNPVTTPCHSIISGPMEPFEYTDPDTNESACLTGFEDIDTINKGKGRIIMGTYGAESLGTRFTFGVGIVVALHE
jgi:hypothetical protein